MDGYGSGSGIERCAASAGLVLSDGDCDDSRLAATTTATIWYVDADGDGQGDAGNSLQSCVLYHQVLLLLQVTAMIAMVRSI